MFIHTSSKYIFLWLLYEETYRGQWSTLNVFVPSCFVLCYVLFHKYCKATRVALLTVTRMVLLGLLCPGPYPPSGLPVPPGFPPFWALPCLSLGVPGPRGFPWPFWALPGPSLVPPWVLLGLSLGEVRGVRFCDVRCEE